MCGRCGAYDVGLFYWSNFVPQISTNAYMHTHTYIRIFHVPPSNPKSTKSQTTHPPHQPRHKPRRRLLVPVPPMPPIRTRRQEGLPLPMMIPIAAAFPARPRCRFFRGDHHDAVSADAGLDAVPVPVPLPLPRGVVALEEVAVGHQLWLLGVIVGVGVMIGLVVRFHRNIVSYLYLSLIHI